MIFKKLIILLRHLLLPSPPASPSCSRYGGARLADSAVGKSACAEASADAAGCSAARLAHLVWDQRVAGSNPATPTVDYERVIRFLTLSFFCHLHTI